jgi:hypothetical protein
MICGWKKQERNTRVTATVNKTWSFAICAHVLHLLDHVGAKLTDWNLHAWTLASNTSAWCTGLWSRAAQTQEHELACPEEHPKTNQQCHAFV